MSTASPAINAWMNPSNRLAIRIVHMVRTMYRRSTATVACLMAEALEGQRITLPKVISTFTKLIYAVFYIFFVILEPLWENNSFSANSS